MTLYYFERKTVYYATLISELQGKSYSDVFELVSPVFCESNNTRLKDIITNSTFQRLDSSQAINMHINYVQSFCRDNTEFGKDQMELEALEARLAAITLIEELSKDAAKDVLAVLLRLQKEKGYCTAAVALLLYAQGHFDSQSRAMLGKALKGGDLDSGIIALYFAEESHREQLYAEIIKMPESYLYPEIKDILSAYYTQNNSVQAKNIPEGGV